LTSSQVEAAMSNAITTTLKNPNFPLAVDITRIRGTNVATSVNGVGSHFPIATYTSALNVTETNPVSGSGGGTSLTQQQVETAMDNALANATGISVTESSPVNTVSVNNHPTPVTTVSVDNHPTSTTITGTVSVTETNPVSGGGGGGGGGTSLTQLQVETAMGNALANATGISVTETVPVTAVKITGDDSYGIIMSKNYFNTNNQSQDYDCRGMGLGAFSGYNSIQGPKPNGGISVTSDGWTIRCNGIDIHNQDITIGLRGTTPTPTPDTGSIPSFISSAASHPLLIPIFSQQVLDKYHGRKVTRSGFANIWIIEPVVKEAITGTIMTERYATTQGTGNAYFGSGFGDWTIRSNGTDIVDQTISEGLPLNAYTGQTGNNPFLSINISDQATIDKYHGLKVTLSSVANVWIVEPEIRANREPLGTIQWASVSTPPSSVPGYQQFMFSIVDDDGIEYTQQAVYTALVMPGVSNEWPTNWSNLFAGVRVVRVPHHGPNRWQMISIGTH